MSYLGRGGGASENRRRKAEGQSVEQAPSRTESGRCSRCGRTVEQGCASWCVEWTPPVEVEDQGDDNARRSARRAKGEIRRYCVHNNLRYMPTLTYRTGVEGVPRIGEDMRQFRRRLLRTGWFGDATSFPYAWVPEAGSKLGRLHVHIAVEWWARLGCVEVCQRCATPGLREKRSDIPPAGSRCVGCVWGKGFVGAPDEGNGDPRLVALYASKYVAKGFEEGRLRAQRYSVAEGFSPEPVIVQGDTLDQVLRQAVEAMGGDVPKVEALHEIVSGWEAPPTWSLTWEVE